MIEIIFKVFIATLIIGLSLAILGLVFGGTAVLGGIGFLLILLWESRGRNDNEEEEEKEE